MSISNSPAHPRPLRLPDVQQDDLTDACRRVGLQDVHQFLLGAGEALDPGNVHLYAQRAFLKWAQEGYDGLDEELKRYILAICNGERL